MNELVAISNESERSCKAAVPKFADHQIRTMMESFHRGYTAFEEYLKSHPEKAAQFEERVRLRKQLNAKRA